MSISVPNPIHLQRGEDNNNKKMKMTNQIDTLDVVLS